MARRYLLAIDGGGLRGIIPATALVKLEQETGRPARETFSFLAGTSTGAIIAAALAAGVPATRILEFYRLQAGQIFAKSPWSTIQRLASGSMYSTTKLRELIGSGIGPAATWRVNDAHVDLLITAKRVRDGKPWYFVKDKPSNSKRTGHLPLLDCVTASAAEPTYFAPWPVPDLPPVGEDPVGRLVGGGVGVAGNPVYQACVEAFYYTGEYTPDETTVVSLGTGRFAADQDPTNLWSWLEWVLGELLRSPGEQQTEIVHRHFVQDRNPPLRFYRLDAKLTRNIPMDDVGAVDEFLAAGEQFAAQIDWRGILDDTNTSLLVTAATTRWNQYGLPVQ